MRASNQPQFDASEEAPAARGRRKRSKTTVAARGRRYAKAEKAAIMKLVDAGSIERAVEHHGVTLNTIARWQKERERRAVVAAPASASPVRTPRPYARDVAIEAVVPAPRAKKPRPFARDVAVLAPMLPEADRREAGIASPDDGDALALTFAQPVRLPRLAAGPRARLQALCTPGLLAFWLP